MFCLGWVLKSSEAGNEDNKEYTEDDDKAEDDKYGDDTQGCFLYWLGV